MTRITYITTYDPARADLGGGAWVDSLVLKTLRQSYDVEVYSICGDSDSGRVPLEIRGSKALLAATLFRMVTRGEPYQSAKFRMSSLWKQEVRNARHLDQGRSQDHLIVTSQWPALLLLADAGVTADLHIAHNVDTVLAQRHDPLPFKWIRNARRMNKDEQEILRNPKSVVALSTSDAKRIQEWGIKCTHLNVSPVKFPERTRSATTIGFIGKATWPPNAIAINLLVNEVLPRVQETLPQARVVLCGRGTDRFSDRPGVTSLGRIDKLSEFYNLADLVVVPRLGQSTGVSVKMLEAISYGRPVIVPTKLAGDAGLRVGAILAEDVDEMARAIVDYFTDRGGKPDMAPSHENNMGIEQLVLDDLRALFPESEGTSLDLRSIDDPASS